MDDEEKPEANPLRDKVQRGQPAPDLFLFAANQLGYSPKDCLVIEDSVAGIQAACEAGMDTIAFLGGGHAGFEWYKERIKIHNVPIAYDSAEIWTMIREYMKPRFSSVYRDVKMAN